MFTVFQIPRAPSQFIINTQVCCPTVVFQLHSKSGHDQGLLRISSANIVFIHTLLGRSFTVCVVIFNAFKDDTVAFLFGTF